jgi:hypothetical protein
MGLVLKDKAVVARKSHRCWYCGESIAVGEHYLYRCGTNYGDFWTMHAHPECDAIIPKDWDEGDWECAEPGSYKRPEVIDFVI